MTDWKTLPKLELHLHLEGGAPPEFIRMLASEKGLSLDGVFDENGAYAWSNFAEFLVTYHKACSVLTGPEEFRRLTEAVLAKSASDGVIYTELFVAPDIFEDGDAAAFKDYMAAIFEGAANAKAVHGIEARFISTAIRNLGPERAVNAAKISADNRSDMLTGFGMGGEERDFTAADFVPAFAVAAEAGLGITSHAGELCGPDSVSETLDHLPVSRIGHGVRAIEDPDLVKRIADEGVVLETNPGSNISLNVFSDWSSHPIQKLREAGCKVTVSTDDPPYFHTDMAHEYHKLAEVFGWHAGDFLNINLAAADAAFCDDATRSTLIARLNEAYT